MSDTESDTEPRRGVLYIVWGEGMEMTLDRSIASVQRQHPELKIHVQRLPEGATLLEKSRMAEFTPFDETLYLDIDTIVLGNLDFGFEKAAVFGAACAICENPWARRYGGIGGDTVEYNTGVLFFTAKAAPLFDAWKQAVGEVDSSLVHIVDGGQKVRMPLNDQAGFARAVEETAGESLQPFILPMNWNFRSQFHLSWFGPIKIWHGYADVPDALLEHNRKQMDENEVIGFSRLQ